VKTLNSTKSWNSVPKAEIAEIFGVKINVSEWKDTNSIILLLLNWSNNLFQDMNGIVLIHTKLILFSLNVLIFRHKIFVKLGKNDYLTRHIEGLKPQLKVVHIFICDAWILLIDNWLNIKCVSSLGHYFTTEFIIINASMTIGMQPITMLWFSQPFPIFVNVWDSFLSC